MRINSVGSALNASNKKAKSPSFDARFTACENFRKIVRQNFRGEQRKNMFNTLKYIKEQMKDKDCILNIYVRDDLYHKYEIEVLSKDGSKYLGTGVEFLWYMNPKKYKKKIDLRIMDLIDNYNDAPLTLKRFFRGFWNSFTD